MLRSLLAELKNEPCRSRAVYVGPDKLSTATASASGVRIRPADMAYRREATYCSVIVRALFYSVVPSADGGLFAEKCNILP